MLCDAYGICAGNLSLSGMYYDNTTGIFHFVNIKCQGSGCTACENDECSDVRYDGVTDFTNGTVSCDVGACFYSFGDISSGGFTMGSFGCTAIAGDVRTLEAAFVSTP